MKNKIIIIVTVPVVLETWLKGQAKFLSKYYDIEIITSYSDTIEGIKAYENVSIKTLDFTRQINIFKDIKVLIQLFFYLMKERPLIVYTLTPKAGLLGMIASWMARIRHRVHNVVGLPHLEAKGKRRVLLTLTEKITYFFANKLYCNSFNLRDIMSIMTNKEVSIIANGSVNGVDTDYFSNQLSQEAKNELLQSLKLKDNDFILTFVGRIVKDKGINELLRVFDTMSQNNSKIKLLLIGDYKNESDPISPKSRQIIQDNPSVRYIEFQEDIRKYLSISHLFVLPSYREGLPNVLIEAGSFGIPLVATNINGCNEVIEDGKNGLLIEKKDEDSLKVALEKLIYDRAYYQKIEANVRGSIVEKYNQNSFWKALHKEFVKIGESSR